MARERKDVEHEDDASDEDAPAPRVVSASRSETPRVDPSTIPLDADGRERPLFVTGFPSDPELDALVAAFEVGDYATVRARAPELAARHEDPGVRAAAAELRRRIDPDPLMKYLLGAAVVLLVALTLWASSHGH
jgi:hypothetical protein